MRALLLALLLFVVSAAPAAAAGKVLLLPGGGWQTYSDMRPWERDFEAAGIDAEIVYYPLRDVPAAIAHVRARARAHPGPVVAYGVSAGGTIAAALAAEGSVVAGVNVVGPTDFTRWTGAGVVYMRQIGMTTYAQKRAASPYWKLGPWSAPLLQQCGLADPLVSYEQCLRHHQGARRYQRNTRLDPMMDAHHQQGWDRAAARRWVAPHVASVGVPRSLGRLVPRRTWPGRPSGGWSRP